MKCESTIRRSLLTVSTQCCLLVVVFAGLVAPSDSAAAAMMMSEQSVSSAQMLSAIEGGGSQLGRLSVWYDVALSDASVPTSMGANSRSASSRSGGMSTNGLDLTENQSILKLLLGLDFVLASSPATGSASGFSTSGSSGGGTSTFLAAILVPQTRFPVPVLNHFWRGVDFLFVPPVVPDELLRPPQI